MKKINLHKYNDKKYNHKSMTRLKLLSVNKFITDSNKKPKELLTFNDMQLYCSISLDSYAKLLKETFSMKNYSDTIMPTLFLGIYTSTDLLTLQNHIGPKYILWRESDINLNYIYRRLIFNYIKTYIKNITHITVSHITQNKLQRLGIKSIFHKLDLSISSSKNIVNYADNTLTSNHTKFNSESVFLILATQYPSYGGAATLAYEFHKKLLENNIKSRCVFFNTRKINENLCNPNNLENVHSEKLCVDYNSNFALFYSELLLKINPSPTVIIGFNYVAPIIGKKLYENIPVYYYITGSKYISDTQITAQAYLESEYRMPNDIDNIELYATNIVDYIIPNSHLTKNIFTKLYSNINHKLTNVLTLEELFFRDTNKIVDKVVDKVYDIAVVSSRYDRTVKNIDLINNIFSDPKLKNFKKVCIGKDSDKFIVNSDYHFGFVDKSTVDEILLKTKLVLITSYYESLSITLIQALNNNCIVLSNKNVGGSIYLDKYYILDNYDSNIWTDKIETIINNYDYHKNLFIANVPTKLNIIDICNKLTTFRVSTKKNVVFGSIDKPYEAGSATNTMNLINFYKTSNNIRPIGLFFISNYTGINIREYKKIDIYFVTVDKNIDAAINLLLEELNQKYGTIDLFFLKNYKSFIFISKYVDLEKIIYSPSGLRIIASQNDYYDKLDFSKVIANINNNNIFDTNMSTYDFINKYDLYLEDYIFKVCKNILPNSELTYNCILQLYKPSYNLLRDINLTFIDFDTSKVIEKKTKKYDIAFVCHSWKRGVKNYNFIKEFIKREKIKKLKILIIGKNQTIKSTNNITIIDNVTNDKIKQLYQVTNILCSNSYYDSSPNVIKEALQNGCKILTTKNIGNHSIFNKRYIINDYTNLQEWENKIFELLEMEFNIADILKHPYIVDKTSIYIENIILSTIENQNNKILNKSDNIGIYKLDPLWDRRIDNSNIQCKYKKLVFNNNQELKLIKKTFNYDLYFDYFITNFDGNYLENNKNYHYVCLSYKNLNEPLYFNLKDMYPYMKSNIYIWFISDKTHISLFENKAKYYFRGNYYNAYNSIKKNSYCELYTATSLIFNKDCQQVTGEIVKHHFDKVLIDPDNYELYKIKFPNSHIVPYNKKPTSEFIYLGMNRDIDYIFVATELQVTKNRNLFVDFVSYCEKNKIKTTIANIGKPDNYYSEKLKDFVHVNYISYDNVETTELITLFNRSKINLLFSGRDSLPRVLIESLACGCYNIALDTLSDGKYLYTGIFGTILSFSDIDKNYHIGSKSIAYNTNDKIFEEIIKYKNNNFNHELISLKFIKS